MTNCVCLVTMKRMKRAPLEQSSEKIFVGTKEYVWRQNIHEPKINAPFSDTLSVLNS